MRALLGAGAALAIVASLLILRIALHLYVDHDQLDVFHLVASIAAATMGVLLLRRALAHRSG